MTPVVRYPFLPRGGANGPLDLVPLLPACLSRNGIEVDVVGLVDSGATFSVLPYDVGALFGVDWNLLPNSLSIGGVGRRVPAKMLSLEMTFGPIGPVVQSFAWISDNSMPVIFGLVTFFLSVDVFFYRTRGYFEIQPATAATP